MKNSPPLDKPLRELCPVCRERPAKPETGICEQCELEAQAGCAEVIDLDDERLFRKWLDVMRKPHDDTEGEI